MNRSLLVQPLERRTHFSIGAVYSPQLLLLDVTGTDASEAIIVSRDPAGNLRINGGAVPIAGGTATAANTAVIRIAGGAGNDTLRIDFANGAMPPAEIHGGDGADTITGGNANDTIFAGSGNDAVDANGGADLVHLGDGDDTFTWNSGDGSDTIEGQGGFDTLVMNGSNAAENFSFQRSGSRLRLTRDISGVVLDAAGIVNVHLNPAGGADVVNIRNFTGTDVASIRLDLSAAGSTVPDGTADTILLEGTSADDTIVLDEVASGVQVNGVGLALTVLHADPTVDHMRILGGGGADRIDASLVGAGRLPLVLDGGTGNDTILGSGGADNVNGGEGDDLVHGNAGDDLVSLGDGNDTYVWHSNGGVDQLSGDPGHDTLLIHGLPGADRFDVTQETNRVRVTSDLGGIVSGGNVEAVRIVPMAGGDIVTVNDLSSLTLTDVSVDFSIDGTADGAPDQVIFAGNSAANQFSVADIGGGTQVIGFGPPVHVLNADGEDSIRLNGNGGADLFAINQVGAPGSVRRVLVDGGVGTDTTTVNGTAGDGAVVILPSVDGDAVNVNIDQTGTANALFDATARIGTLTIGAGGTAAITPGGEKVLIVSSLNLSVGGRMDISDNSMVIDYAGSSPLPSVMARLSSGFAGGTWSGAGIVSTVAANDPVTAVGFAESSEHFSSGIGLFKGVFVDSTAVLLTHTLAGDANLDDRVDLADFSRLAANFGRTGLRWTQGDFNYDAAVDLADFARLASNFGASSPAGGFSAGTTVRESVLT